MPLRGEPPLSVSTESLPALLDSLICDYADAGANVRLTGIAGAPVTIAGPVMV